MSNLWDLSHIQPETRVVLEGETIPALFKVLVQRFGELGKRKFNLAA